MSGNGDAIEVAGVRLTSPDRILYDDPGITKRALAEFYREIAGWVLPQLADRPLTLLRCPGGQGKDCFVQRRADEGAPRYVRRVTVAVEGEGEATHLAVDSLRGVLYLVQLGVLEIHTWGARRDRLERPDRMIFDLDPGPGVPFPAVIDAALGVRALLRELELESFVKTSGGRGLHVVAPLARTSSWDEVLPFSRALAETLERRDPARFVAVASKTERGGKVYVDYLRNAYGATAVAAYSTRAKPGAPVSTPLAWEELGRGARPGDYTVLTLPERLRRLERDPWEAYPTTRQQLTRARRAAMGAR